MASFAVGISFLSSAQGALWTSGHGDFGLEYGDEGLEFEVHLGEDTPAILAGESIEDTPFETDQVEVSISNTFTAVGLGEEFLTGAGTTEGATIQYLPPTSTELVPLLGVGAEELVLGDWTSLITFELVEVNGPGNFAAFLGDPDSGFDFAFSTADGISSDNMTTLAAGNGHQEFGWSFSEPGTYEVTLRASGVHIDDGPQSTLGTFTFTSVPEPSSALLLGLGGLLAFRRRRTA